MSEQKTGELWAYCEECETLFLGLTGAKVGHFCSGSRIESEAARIVTLIADGDHAAGEKAILSLVKHGATGRTLLDTRLARRVERYR